LALDSPQNSAPGSNLGFPITMTTITIAIAAFFGYLIAYHTYGRYLARKIFDLRPDALVPAQEMKDGVDFVPTPRSIVFGHHFTSIAGTGPIVGPAIAVLWGWLPALLWVLVGSIFIGAVHDFGALVLSLRSRGQTIGDIAGRMISLRARLLFLLILFFALMVVLAVFGLVIALIFATYPQSVLSVWASMPLAILIGLLIHRKGRNIFWASMVSLAIVYLALYVGVRHFPVTLGSLPLFAGAEATLLQSLGSQVVFWTGILLVYCFIASVLPVWLLLQPRDYINALQLVVALLLLMAGILIAHPPMVAPALTLDVLNAPPILPFLFITIACGAISGFHCLVSSGTSSKQIRKETDAQAVGYGAMLLEGALAVVVILACTAGLGMGRTHEGVAYTGLAAWQTFYTGDWQAMQLRQMVGAFVEGGANMVSAVGIPLDLGIGLIAVMVACFAATTIDTATRLQRYVIQELGGALRLRALKNKYIATGIAVGTGGVMAMVAGPQGPGSGGLILWPLFGAINQLLAGLAFLVIAFYLIRHKKPVWFLAFPLGLMIVLPAWALSYQLKGFYTQGNFLLFSLGLLILGLQAWMILEGALMWRSAKGNLPTPLPPLTPAPAQD
jgi:carbon starvation protein